MADNQKIMIGHKLRKLRKDLSISQAQMAAELNISASYLNLLENNARPVTVSLLFKLGQTYDIDLRDIAEDDSERLTARMSEIFADPALSSSHMSRRDIHQLASQHPSAAQAFIQLHDAYEAMRGAAFEGGTKQATGDLSGPVDKVRQYLEDAGNYFPALEQAASDCRNKAKLRPGFLFADLAHWLKAEFDLTVRVMPQDVMGTVLRQHDFHRNRLLLSEILKEHQKLFQIAMQTALILHDKLINDLVREAGFDDLETRQLLRITLSGYFAGALMMPYDAFLQAAQTTRYDIDLLCLRFNAGYEQVCHRLTTLNRPGQRGIPFFFLRVDEAGYISKRLSGGGVELARHGGSCSRWVPHQVFRTAGQIRVQCAELENGHRFFTIARTVLQPRAGPAHHGTPLFAIALGCEMKHMKDIAYADSMTSSKSVQVTPIGLGCQVCERLDCGHRGSPPVGHKLQFDPTKRKSGLFDFA